MKKTLLALPLLALLASCHQSKSTDYVAANTEISTTNYQTANEGYDLMKNNCYVCHNPKVASHDDNIAPPFKAVKNRYTKAYSDRTDFINAVVDFVQNPEEDKALMKGAMKQYKLMPKLPLPTEDLEKIAAYIYDNEVEAPVWMEAHMK
jgi:mono/diheme cytochrome c family protein